MFNGNHGKMNYTDSVRDLMIYVHNTLKQMTEAGTQLKVEEEEQRRGGAGSPHAPPSLSMGPLWEAARKTDPGLHTLRVARRCQAPAEGAGRASPADLTCATMTCF